MRRFLYILDKKLDRFFDKHPMVYLYVFGTISIVLAVASFFNGFNIFGCLCVAYFIWITISTYIEIKQNKK